MGVLVYKHKTQIDRVFSHNGNVPMPISDIRDAIIQEFGCDLSYGIIYYVLNSSEYQGDYIKDLSARKRTYKHI